MSMNLLEIIIMYLVALGYCMVILKQVPKWKIFLASVITIIGALIGARLWWMINHLPYIKLQDVFSLTFQNYKVLGGLVGIILTEIGCCKLLKIPTKKLMIATIEIFFVATCIAKIGCFFQGCCRGCETSLPWGIRYPDIDYTIHPVQLYEAISLLLIFIFLKLSNHKISDITRVTIGVLFYLIVRVLLEEIYVDSVLFGNLPSSILYFVGIIICIIIIIIDKKRSKQNVR